MGLFFYFPFLILCFVIIFKEAFNKEIINPNNKNILDDKELSNSYDKIAYQKVISELEKNNFTSIFAHFKEIREYENTDKIVNSILKKLKLNDINLIEALPNNYTNIIAEMFYFVGQMEYYGHLKPNPNLEEGLAKIIISGYFGNKRALYSLYTAFENDIITKVINTNSFKNLISKNPLLNQITQRPYYTNFNLTMSSSYSPELRSTLAMQFLYSSALGRYEPSMNTLGNKFFKGYGLPSSCTAALKYYMETAHITIAEIANRKSRNLYQYPSLIDYEYIHKKFESKVEENVADRVEYLKLYATKGDKSSTKKLADLYLFGIGIKKNNKEALKWFEHGSKLNDTACTFYLGEMYLNGWGTQVDYQKALKLFETAAESNYTRAWNSIGYMYYYGYGVEQDKSKAFEYFKKAINKDKLQDAMFNALTMMIEPNNPISPDYSQAYQYANRIASQGHTFGSYFFAMLNQFNLGSTISMCEINIEYFKQVAERSILEKNKFDLASEYYFSGRHKSSALLYMELAEEGFEAAQINAAIILKKYNIFKDKSLQNFLTYKYMKMASKNDNIFALLSMADFYFEGFGDLDKNYKKAMSLYKKVIKKPSLNSFYQAHARFKVGFMYTFGLGDDKNLTLAYKYFNQTSYSGTSAKYPAMLMMKYIDFVNNTYFNITMKQGIKLIIKSFINKRWKIYLFFSFVIFYLFFFFSLYTQKE